MILMRYAFNIAIFGTMRCIVPSLNTRNDIHWYCDKCQPKVLRSIQLDKETEKKLDISWAKVDDRISQVNKDIESVKENTNDNIQAVI